MVDSAGSGRAMRADARRNRELIVAAAREIFVERGLDAPMEEIARRAGVGVGTLYRRFPDRAAVIEAVAVDGMRRVVDLVPSEPERESDPAAALQAFLRRCIEHRLGELQVILHERIVEIVTSNEELRELRRSLFELVAGMVHRAQDDGAIRGDISPGDVLLILGLTLRPIPGVPAETADLFRRRVLAISIEGLRGPAERPLAGTPLDIADLDPVRRAETSPADH